MKLSSKGIGWLIAGVVICASAFPGTGIGDIMSTLMIGLVFIAVYVMKQRFRPAGTGWFIAGGFFMAFTVDCFFDVAGSFFSQGSNASGDLSSVVIGAAVTCFLMFMFYSRNKEVLKDVADGADYSDEGEFGFPYQEQVFREDTVEPVSEKADADGGNEAPAGEEGIIEFEVTDGSRE